MFDPGKEFLRLTWEKQAAHMRANGISDTEMALRQSMWNLGAISFARAINEILLRAPDHGHGAAINAVNGIDAFLESFLEAMGGDVNHIVEKWG